MAKLCVIAAVAVTFTVMLLPVTCHASTSNASSSSSSTKVSVLEVGPPGTVRRTSNAVDNEVTMTGVTSFWQTLHNKVVTSNSKMFLPADLPVVPDLFRKPFSGIVIGLTGIDSGTTAGMFLELMPTVQSIFAKNPVMEVSGSCCNELVSGTGPEWEEVSISTMSATILGQTMKKNGFYGVKTVVDQDNAASIDQQLNGVLQNLTRFAEEQGETVVVHLIVEQEHDIKLSRRRLSESRNLEDAQGADGNNGADNQEDAQENNGYYGYGYYNTFGEWVTPFKTIFQIQYFNVVLWTSLGLVMALIYTIFLMINMPMEADTLLFGESAKFIGEE